MKTILTLLIIGVFFSSCANKQTSEVVSPDEFQTMMDKMDDEQLIDVRTPQEFLAGHIENATNIDIYDTDFFNSEIDKLDKDKPVLVYCKSGSRSREATSYLMENGFKEVYDLDGGFTKWENSNLTISK